MPELWVHSHLLMDKKIILLGYMGSGKSSVGQMLARDLDIPFADLDDYIEDRLKMSIPDIFGKKGEIYFRKQEHNLLREMLQSNIPTVLALGGGTPCYSQNMELVKSFTAYVFYLKLSIPSLAHRLKTEKEHRPLISHLGDEELPEFIGKHLFERNPYYNQATHIIDIENLNKEKVVEKIKEYLV